MVEDFFLMLVRYCFHFQKCQLNHLPLIHSKPDESFFLSFEVSYSREYLDPLVVMYPELSLSTKLAEIDHLLIIKICYFTIRHEILDSNLLITVLMLSESALLTPDVLESPELNLVRFTTEIASVVLDSDKDLKCFALLFCCICDGKVPTGRVLERCVDVEIFNVSSKFLKSKMSLKIILINKKPQLYQV